MTRSVPKYTYRDVRSLDADDQAEQLAFLRRYLEVDEAGFEASLRRADVAVEYREADALVGFGLVRTLEFDRGDRKVRVIWTGSAALDPSARGRLGLETAALRYLARELRRHPTTPLYWYFETFSYKSYRVLARSFPRFWPHPASPMPSREARLLDAIGRDQHGARWDSATGVAATTGKRLRVGVAPIPPALLDDPFVRFFTERNPAHAEGAMLGCLCPLDASNLVPFAWGFAKARALRLVAPDRSSRGEAAPESARSHATTDVHAR